ncbi:MAG: hypothetical protein HZB38_04550 [Planctomycetes bacterium]|nr:hypothetical protein [Planctomycetota bacterium]
MRAALEFLVACGDADGQQASERVEAIGYQCLPREGSLPEQPERPVLPSAVREQVGQRQKAAMGGASIRAIKTLDYAAAQHDHAEIAKWMLKDDFLFEWRSGADASGPVEFIVVRVRGRRATVAGGTFPAFSRG